MQRKLQVTQGLNLPFPVTNIMKYDYFITQSRTIQNNTTYHVTDDAIVLNDDIIAYGFKNDIIILNTVSQDNQILKGHTHEVTCLVKNGDQLLSGSANGDIRIWDSDFICIEVIRGHRGRISHIICMKDKIISADDNGICIWDENRDVSIVELGENMIYFERIDDKIVFTERNADTARLMDMKGNIGKYPDYEFDKVSCVLVAYNKIIIGDEEGNITINDSKNEFLSFLESDTSEINCLCAISEDILVSGTINGEIIIWDKNRIKHKISLEGVEMPEDMTNVISHIKKLPNNNIAVASYNPSLHIYNIETGKLVSVLSPNDPDTSKLLVLPNRKFVNVLINGTVIIWE